MAILSPAQIREKLRLGSVHPADRPEAMAAQVKKELEAPVQGAVRMAEKVAGRATQSVEKLEEVIAKLKAQMATVQMGLEVRKRMTPQDLRDALNGLFATYNFSPAEEMVMMLKNPEHPHYVSDPRLRVSMLQDLNSYVMPKLKSTEITGEVKHNHTITIMRIGEDGEVKKLEKIKQAVPIEARVERADV